MKDSSKENIELFVILDSFNIFTFSILNSLEDIIGVQFSVDIERKLGLIHQIAKVKTGIFSS